MSDSVRPYRRQLTRLPHPWDSPGKNTAAGCHFLLQCMKVKSESEVAQSCPTLSDPMDCSPPGSSVHGTFQARAAIVSINTPVCTDMEGCSDDLWKKNKRKKKRKLKKYHKQMYSFFMCIEKRSGRTYTKLLTNTQQD